MGAAVREPAAQPPPRYTRAPCPTCGLTHRVVNGAWLRWKREKAGLDQRTLAARLGLSGPYLSDLERNRRALSPTVERAYRRLRPRRRS